MRISKVTLNSVVIVRFNYRVQSVQNYSLIDDKVLRVKIIPGEDSDPNYLGFLWNVTLMRAKEMRINLTFEHPERISSQMVRLS